jgi:hypothetical protein
LKTIEKLKDDQEMFKIDRTSNRGITRLLISGCIQSCGIDCIRSAMDVGSGRKILDLSEVTVVDVAVVSFLIRCEEEGIQLVNCPSYVREWMVRERAEGSEQEPHSIMRHGWKR